MDTQTLLLLLDVLWRDFGTEHNMVSFIISLAIEEIHHNANNYTTEKVIIRYTNNNIFSLNTNNIDHRNHHLIIRKGGDKINLFIPVWPNSQAHPNIIHSNNVNLGKPRGV